MLIFSIDVNILETIAVRTSNKFRYGDKSQT
jgi:hypothetical protein